MKKEFGKWLMDVAKYMATVVHIQGFIYSNEKRRRCDIA